MDARFPAGTKLIFLVGAPRSGTTWLQILLSSMPEIATINETHLFSLYLKPLFSTWRQLADAPRTIGFHDLFTSEEWQKSIREFAYALLSKILNHKPTARIVLEKSPDHVRCWREIHSTFPDASFIHLIRDPRAVVASLFAANRSWAADWSSSKTIDNCATWIDDVKAGREIPKATPNYLEVRYEDLVRNGPETLRSTFSWCGINISTETAVDLLEKYKIDQLRSGKAEGVPWPVSTEPVGFFRKGEAEGWRSELKPRQIALTELMARDLMIELGYQLAMEGNRISACNAWMQMLLLGKMRGNLLSWCIRLGRKLIPPALIAREIDRYSRLSDYS
jgi:Sulfotransferase family